MNEPIDAAEDRTVEIDAGDLRLEATLHLPEHPRGLIVLMEGITGGRFRSRNWFVAGVMHDYDLATLVVDMLDDDEEPLGPDSDERRFDITDLTERLIATLDWIGTDNDIGDLPVGLFGASIGAAAALVAASRRPDSVDAIVSRGGRPDLAEDELPDVSAPTLLLVGSNDFQVIELNEEALEQLGSDNSQMSLISGASHFFTEPGTLERVAHLAGKWFEQHVRVPAS